MSNGTNGAPIWTDTRLQTLTDLVVNEIKPIRKVRPLLPLFGTGTGLQSTVPNHQISLGPPISIPPGNPPLTTVRLSIEFKVFKPQFDQEYTIEEVARRSALNMAFVEDAVILLGGAGAAAKFAATKLQVTDEDSTLPTAAGLLPQRPPTVKKAIVQSILDGMQTLRQQNQHGEFCVILSPDLHKEAYEPIPGTAIPAIGPILPQLKENGVAWSDALDSKTAVIFSTAGVDLAIPEDTHVELRKVEGDAFLAVTQQFLLRINDPTAIVGLK